MSPFDVAQIAGGLGAGSALPWLWKKLRSDPKAQAEARKINADADDRIIGRLYREIERLDGEMTDVRTELAAVKDAAATEKTALERENKALRAKVSRLQLRVDGLEDIIRAGPMNDDELRRLLSDLDRKTGEGEGHGSD